VCKLNAFRFISSLASAPRSSKELAASRTMMEVLLSSRKWSGLRPDKSITEAYFKLFFCGDSLIWLI